MAWLSGAALLAGATLSLAWSDSRGQSPDDDATRTVTGKVKDFTTAPRGEIDGAVLEDGTVIHWPPHLEDRFKGIVARGDRVRVSGRMETGPAGDTHLEVRNVTNLRTKASQSNDDDTPPPPRRGKRGRQERRPVPPPPPPPAEDREMKTMTSKVKDFTTAPRGEIDGAVLEDGTLIHWPPHLEDTFKGILNRGDRVRVTGWMETGRRGDTHLEVRTVTNLRTNASRSNDNDAPPPPPRGARRGGPERAAADPPADRDQRVRDLERQVEQLRRENERLRRER
jgi:hypothetical protein